MNKTDDYINKMKNLSVELKNIIKNNSKDKSSTEYINADKVLKKIEDKLKKYESENKEIIEPIIFQEVSSSDNLNDEVNNVGNNLKDLNNEKKNKNIKLGSVKNLNIKDIQPQQVEIKVNITEKKKKPENPVSCNKKYKKYIRRIDKLKLLYQVIERDYNPMTISNNRCICFYNVILFITFGIAICTDFILPIALNMRDDFIDDSGEFKKTEESKFALAVSVIISLAICVVTSSYTIITIYSSKRRRYISGDYLYDKKINDNLSLLKTVQFICGFSFAVIYCNLYFWKTLDKKGVFGRPYYYDQVIIPDYTLKNGITIYMIIKIIIIIISILAALIIKLTKISFFKNDLTEFNSKSWRQSKYDNDQELNRVINENKGIVNILKREIKY
jgi:hypothetical protein